MKIVILYNAPGACARPDERDGIRQAELIKRALRAMGHQVGLLSFDLDLSRVRRELIRENPDLAFNLVEAVDGSDRLIYLGPLLLDQLAIPYTGASTAGMFLTSNKLLAKKMMHRERIPTPPWFSPEEDATFVEGKYIVKAIWEHASVGIDQEAITEVTARAELQKFLARRQRKTGRDCFAERYIAGREFNLSLLASPEGPEVLPPAEMEFIGYPEDRDQIVDYAAKWEPSSWQYHKTRRRFPFPGQDETLLARLKDISLNCWRLFGLRGWARVDFRVDQSGNPWVLEVNVNPGLGEDAGFLAAAKEAGLDLTAVLGRIMADAVRGEAR